MFIAAIAGIFNRGCIIERWAFWCYLFPMKLAQLPQVMALSTEEKLELIDELWISIEPELDRIPVSEEEKRLLDERLAEHAAHPEDTLTLEQLKKAVAANLK